MKIYGLIEKGKALLLKRQSSAPSPDTDESGFYLDSSGDPIYVKDASDVETTDEVVLRTNTLTLTNKTLTTPTIGDFTNANHTHADAANGGTVSHTALTDKGTNTHTQIDSHITDSNIHVDHTAVSITAGNGLSGGGTLASTRTLDLDFNELAAVAIASGDELAFADITDSNIVKKITFGNFESTLNHDNLAGFVSDEHVAHSSISISSGGILSGGGTIDANQTITLAHSDVDHDQTTNFVADEHVAHSSISISSGGILSGGGTIDSNQTITLNHSDVDHDQTTNYVANEHIDWTSTSENLNTSGTITTKSSLIIEDPGAGTETITVQAPTLSASYTLTLPTTDGALNEYLQTDGSGNLSWASAGTGDVTGPASSVDTELALFNSTTGKVIKGGSDLINPSSGTIRPTSSNFASYDLDDAGDIRTYGASGKLGMQVGGEDVVYLDSERAYMEKGMSIARDGVDSTTLAANYVAFAPYAQISSGTTTVPSDAIMLSPGGIEVTGSGELEVTGTGEVSVL